MVTHQPPHVHSVNLFISSFALFLTPLKNRNVKLFHLSSPPVSPISCIFHRDDYFLLHKESKRYRPGAFSSLIPRSLDVAAFLMPVNCFVDITWMSHRHLQHIQDRSHSQTPLPLLIPVLASDENNSILPVAQV